MERKSLGDEIKISVFNFLAVTLAIVFAVFIICSCIQTWANRVEIENLKAKPMSFTCNQVCKGVESDWHFYGEDKK